MQTNRQLWFKICSLSALRFVMSRCFIEVDMQGNHAYGYTMTKQDVEDFINNECLLELIGDTRIKPKAQYDGLLVAFSGHGTLGSIVCSDGKKIAYSTIREWFQTNQVLLQIPR
eukprot:388659_1